MSLISAASGAAQSLPMGVPDLCAVSPGSTYIAAGQTVTYSGSRSATCLGVHGTLVLASNTTLTVQTLLVYPDGKLLVGTTAAPAANVQIVFTDSSINTTADPEQYGHGLVAFGEVTMIGQPRTPTFSRLAGELTAGTRTMTMSDDLSGWVAGDRVIVPDSRQMADPNWMDLEGWQPQWEERTVQSVSGRVVTLTTPLAYNHPGARDAHGVMRFLPHVGNLGRSIVLRSANPAGVRGHAIFMHRANVNLRYVLFKDLGRTTLEPLDSAELAVPGPTALAEHSHMAPEALTPGTNQGGRYALHVHHTFGPTVSSSGYQFQLVGNAVDGAPKWGIAVHNSSFGLVQDNVVYNANGAAFMFEDGQETSNDVVHNFAVRSFGTGGRDAGGREGAGFYFRGPLNRVRDNVAANIFSDGPDASYGYKFFFVYLGALRVPVKPGADTTVAGNYTEVDGNATAIAEFRNNEVYGSESGLTFWWVGTFGITPNLSTPLSVFNNLKVWHVFGRGIFQYENFNVTLKDYVALNSGANSAEGLTGGDYFAHTFRVENPQVEGFAAGLNPSWVTGGTPLRIVGGLLKNTVNLAVPMLATSAFSAGDMAPADLVVDGTRFEALPGQALHAIAMEYIAEPVRNLIQRHTVTVHNYNGQPGDDFSVFYTQQAPAFVVPKTILQDGWPILLGAPVAGLTNAQTWAQYGIAIAGAVAPCSETRSEIAGFVCDADSPPSGPTLSIGPVSLTEGQSGTTVATFTVTLSPTSAQSVTVDYATANGTATAGSDYVAKSGTVTFAAGVSTRPINVTVNGDTIVEPNETFTVTLSNPTNAVLGTATATGTILNDDTAPGLPSLGIGNVTVTEGHSGTSLETFTVTLSPTSTQTVTVDYATANGTATAGSDYVAKSGTVTFAAGVSTRPISITVNGDTTVEPNETFSVTLSSPTNAVLGTATGTGTIMNDDTAPSAPSLSIGSLSLTEGNSGTSAATFTVTLSPASTQTVTVAYATADGTATAGSDYAARSGTLIFPAGVSTRSITISVNGDTAVEPDETFSVTLSSPTNAALGTATGTGTILNDDTGPSPPTLHINSVTAAEGDSGTTLATFAVTLSAPPTQTVTVDYTTANGTAVAGSDYGARSGTLTFLPGVSTRPISVTVNGDTTVEPDETFTVTLTNVANAVFGTATGTATILNDDAAPSLPSLGIGNVTVTEGHSGTTVAAFTVTLSPTSTQPVTVAYATADGTATAGTDYVAASGTLVFPAGVSTRPINVTINGDTTVELNETFSVILSNPSNAVLVTATGTGTIQNDNNGGRRP